MLVATLIVVVSYLVGSIPTGVIVGRLSGFDPRAVGSGNIGMANVARAAGKGAAAFTFLGDALKGLVPVLIVRLLGFSPAMVAGTAMAAFIGSISSVFLLFKGGKGVACSVGIWLAISPIAVGLAMVVFIVVFAVWRIMSLSSMGAAIVLPPTVAAMALPNPYLLLAILMTALILLRHHENIARLMQGTEPTLRVGKRHHGSNLMPGS